MNINGTKIILFARIKNNLNKLKKMKSSSNLDKNIISLNPLNQISKQFLKQNTMMQPHKKSFHELSSGNVLGETRQNKLNNNNKKIFKKNLFLKKIDLKDLSNKYYLEGIHKIFNEEKLFLKEIYKDNKIVVGKSHNKSETNLLKKSDFNKRNFFKKQSQLTKQKERTFSSTTNLTFRTDSLKPSAKSRKIYGKKKENYITDDDLRNIYQKWIQREKDNNNKKTKIKHNLKFSKINNVSKKEFEGILNLQNLILKKRKERNIETSKMEERLLRFTSKHRDKLLINQINDYRIKKEEIEEMDIKNHEENINNKITSINLMKTPNQKLKDLDQNLQWLSSLRDYEKNDNYKNNYNTIVKNQTNPKKKRCNSSNILNLKNRYISYHSFDKRDVFFNFNCNFDSIYAQIIPSNYKGIEKIRDSVKHIKYFSRNFKRKRERNKLESNILYKTNLFDGLNIRGKKLINFEMELSKELEGKRKRIIKFPYLDNEINSKIFVESNIIKKSDIPQTVKNTVELHYN